VWRDYALRACGLQLVSELDTIAALQAGGRSSCGGL
jgi:hypothetical protein